LYTCFVCAAFMRNKRWW